MNIFFKQRYVVNKRLTLRMRTVLIETPAGRKGSAVSDELRSFAGRISSLQHPTPPQGAGTERIQEPNLPASRQGLKKIQSASEMGREYPSQPFVSQWSSSHTRLASYSGDDGEKTERTDRVEREDMLEIFVPDSSQRFRPEWKSLGEITRDAPGLQGKQALDFRPMIEQGRIKTNKDEQGRTRTSKDEQGQSRTIKDNHGQSRTIKDNQVQSRTIKDNQGRSRTIEDNQGRTRTNDDKQ